MQPDQEDLDRMAWADAKLAERRLEALRQVTMLPGSSDKRFVRQASAKLPESLTEKEHRQLLVIVWKYRRQLPKALVPTINPGDPFADPRTGAPVLEFANG